MRTSSTALYLLANLVALACVAVGAAEGVTLVVVYWLDNMVVSVIGAATRWRSKAWLSRHPERDSLAGAVVLWVTQGVGIQGLHHLPRTLSGERPENPIWILEWLDGPLWVALGALVVAHLIWRTSRWGPSAAPEVLPWRRILKLQIALMIGIFLWNTSGDRDACLYALVAANLMDAGLTRWRGT